MRRALFIAYHYPPIGGSGSQRTAKFAKYLPEHGWFPVVLTVKDAAVYEPTDKSMLAETNTMATVYRAPLVNIATIYQSLRRKQPHDDHIDPPAPTHAKNGSADERQMLERFKASINHLSSIPDKKVGWYLPAVLKGLQIIRREKIEVLYSTSPTPTAHLIAGTLKKLTRKPWAADFRDPWTQAPWENIVKKGTLRGRIEDSMESHVVSNADKIIANTDPLRELFIQDYPALPVSKFVTIPNGFDSEDFESLEIGQRGRAKPFTITHTGEFYNKRTPREFLLALSQFLNESRIPKSDVQVNFVGTCEAIDGVTLQQFLARHNLQGIVHEIGYVPHHESVRWLVHSDVLLLVQPGTTIQIPGKAYEYIRAGKPILTLTAPGATEKLVRSTSSGIVVEPDNIDAIKHAITQLYTEYKQGQLRLNRPASIAQQFDRKELTSKLAEVLGEAVHDLGGSHP